MVDLAKQLIDRQSGRYDPADLEDRYETRLRAMIDAKLKGEGVEDKEEASEPVVPNVVDLMAALKTSLGQTAVKPPGQKSTGEKPIGKKPQGNSRRWNRLPGKKRRQKAGAQKAAGARSAVTVNA